MGTTIFESPVYDLCSNQSLNNSWFMPKVAINPIAETYGLSLHYEGIPLHWVQAYRVSFDYQGAPGGGKVWVRGFGRQAGEVRRLYEKIVFCEKPGAGWVHYQEVFFPTKYRPAVTELRVMLFAYYPAGIYWFDNVVIEPISTAEYDRAKTEASR